jgi:phospholipase C
MRLMLAFLVFVSLGLVAALATTAQPNCCISIQSPITHIVIIDQENRSFNNIFMGLPGATTASTYTDPQGNVWPVSPMGLTQAYPSQSPDAYDPNHENNGFVADCNNGGGLSTCPMNGFNSNGCDDGQVTCASTCPTPTPITYVAPTPSSANLCVIAAIPRPQVSPYWEMAAQYAVGDETFQTNQGPSFPAHNYLLAASSSLSAGSLISVRDNGSLGEDGQGHMGCDSPPGTTVPTINITTGAHSTTFPCIGITSILNELDAAGLTWQHYNYQPNTPYWDNLWTSPDGFSQYGCTYGASVPTCPAEFLANVITPPSKFLTNLGTCGNLANVTWITPTGKASDHAYITDGSGPAWVLSVVNAIGNSCYWNSTAVIVLWDDWGGWYDPIAPTMHNYYENGFRLPFIVISPYTTAGYVSHVTRNAYGSVLQFIESTFLLPSLENADAYSDADNLHDFFSFNQYPRSFSTLSYTGKFTRKWFIATMPHDHTIPDKE